MATENRIMNVEPDPEKLGRQKPEILGGTDLIYDLDEIDGQMYMLDHRLGGCVITYFTKTMAEDGYGRVLYRGRELPKGNIISVKAAGGMQMCGIPVRDLCKEYDAVYELLLENFRDIDGNTMDPVILKVRTLPKPEVDPAYEAHDTIALQAAREGIVLLKNNDQILPLAKDAVISVHGGEKFRLGACGAGRINPRYSIGLFRGISDYSDFVIQEEADTALVVISRASGENLDNNAVKGNYYLSDEEEKLFETLSEKKKHIIAILSTGYPIDTGWIEKYGVDAAVWSGFSGMCGGRALVEILDGRICPSAKLPDTWSLDYWDIPASRNFFLPEKEEDALGADEGVFIDTCYEEGIYVGYRYFETFGKNVAFPFGYGLSYTEFEIKAGRKELAEYCIGETGGRCAAVLKVSVTNKGNTSGKEVIQVYAGIPEGRLEQPKYRLVGFSKTKELAAGESEELEIPVEEKQLLSYDECKAAWVLEKGVYTFYVGNSVRSLMPAGLWEVEETRIFSQSEHLMQCPVEVEVLSKRKNNFPKGERSGKKDGVVKLEPAAVRRHYKEKGNPEKDFVDTLSVEQLARLSVCASHGWGMHEKGEAGRLYRLDGMPAYTVADGNNGVNVKKKNIGMPCSNTVCATWNKELAYAVGAVIAEEAKENEIQMILAPAMNIHRNPLNGRHPEYFSEDPYLTGIIAGNQSKGLEEHGVSSSVKHVIGNNCEASRKRNHSLIPERALREIYLKAFEVALNVHQPDSIMTGYNAVNGCFTASDEEMLQGIFRKEFGFKGFVMTDWGSYDSAGVVDPVAAGNTWMTPGSLDDTYTFPIIEGVREGKIDIERLRANVRYMLRIVQSRTGRNLGVK